MDRMKIEILEKNGPKGWAIEHDTLRLYQGDEVTVPAELGAMLCKAGLARDVGGRVPTGERASGTDTVLVPAGIRTINRVGT